MRPDSHFLNSTLRERIVEHAFVGDVLRTLWRHGITDVEVLRSEFDAHGYDLVMARGQIIRHIQFKTGTTKKPGKVSLARALLLEDLFGALVPTPPSEDPEDGDD